MSQDPEQVRRFAEFIEKELREIVGTQEGKDEDDVAEVQATLDNVMQALVPNMLLGITAELARKFKMEDIPPEVPDSAWLSHDGMTSKVRVGEDGNIKIKLSFANPRWISTTEKMADCTPCKE